MSLLPKWAIAKSFSGTGVRLIATPPTAITGLLSGPVIPATSSATPSATAADRSPASAPRIASRSTRRRLTGFPLIITAPVRSCRAARLAGPGQGARIGPSAPLSKTVSVQVEPGSVRDKKSFSPERTVA